MEFSINQFVVSEQDGIYQDLSKLDNNKSQIVSFYLIDFATKDYKILFICHKINENNGCIQNIEYFGNKVIDLKTNECVEQLPMTLKIIIYNK